MGLSARAKCSRSAIGPPSPSSPRILPLLIVPNIGDERGGWDAVRHAALLAHGPRPAGSSRASPVIASAALAVRLALERDEQRDRVDSLLAHRAQHAHEHLLCLGAGPGAVAAPDLAGATTRPTACSARQVVASTPSVVREDEQVLTLVIEAGEQAPVGRMADLVPEQLVGVSMAIEFARTGFELARQLNARAARKRLGESVISSAARRSRCARPLWWRACSK